MVISALPRNVTVLTVMLSRLARFSLVRTFDPLPVICDEALHCHAFFSADSGSRSRCMAARPASAASLRTAWLSLTNSRPLSTASSKTSATLPVSPWILSSTRRAYPRNCFRYALPDCGASNSAIPPPTNPPITNAHPIPPNKLPLSSLIERPSFFIDHACFSASTCLDDNRVMAMPPTVLGQSDQQTVSYPG